MPLTLAEYETLVYGLQKAYPSIEYATLVLIRLEPQTALLKGELLFPEEVRLRILEVLDFDEGFIQRYSYEVYRGDEKLYWYDSWPHPHDPELSDTYPHHKHIAPDSKHHRVVAPGLSFNEPNLSFLIEEIERAVLRS